MLTDVQIKSLRKALTESVLVTPIDEKYAQAIKRWNDAGEKQAVSYKISYLQSIRCEAYNSGNPNLSIDRGLSCLLLALATSPPQLNLPSSRT